MILPAVEPMRLARLREPFSHPGWIFELKRDGFRALANVEHGTCRFVSRTGNVFASFSTLAQAIADSVEEPALLDDEIVCLDQHGRSQFNDLLFHRGEPYFFAFDLLWHGREDLRHLPVGLTTRCSASSSVITWLLRPFFAQTI